MIMKLTLKKIADASHQFLLANAIKNAKQILKECHFKCHLKCHF